MFARAVCPGRVSLCRPLLLSLGAGKFLFTFALAKLKSHPNGTFSFNEYHVNFIEHFSLLFYLLSF